MEERRVSFAAQNEIDAEQAFLDSMKALQELDEAGASATASEVLVQGDSSVGGESGDGMDLGSGHDAALIGDTEDQKVTPLPDAGASANVGSAITASSFSTSSGAATLLVKPGATQQSTSTTCSPSPPSAASSQRRTAAPFSYDEGDDEPGPAGVISDETGINSAKSTATAPSPSAPPTPTAMAQTFPNRHSVSVTPPVSVNPSNNTTALTPPIALVIPEDISAQTSPQNATPMSATDEIQQSDSVAGVPQEQSQPSIGVISNSSSNVAVPSTSNVGAGVNAPATSAASTTAVPSHKRKRLPQDKVGQLEDRIAEDPRGDIDAWYSLIAEHQKKGKFDEARAVFERFFLVFPACAEQWVAYVKMELSNNEFIRVEQIFSRCLIPVLNVELWSLYLNYIRRRQNLTTDTGGRARAIVSQAYEFVLNNVGLDRDAGQIWQEYVQFVKSSPGNIGGSGWQDQQKMDLLRKVYQRAICIPVQGVEQLWREYDGFEMGLNKITGRKFLQEKSPLFMTARSSYIELNNITAGLVRSTVPQLPPLPGCEGYEEYQKQVELWKRWIQFEKHDPLVLAKDDQVTLRNRIIFVYKQALMALRFYPEIWFEAAEYCFANDMDDQGAEFLKQGIAANPESCLLCFRYAERLEATMPAEDGTGMEGVRRRGQAVRKPYEELLNNLYAQVAKIQQREKDELARIEESNPTSSNATRVGKRRSNAGGEGDYGDDEDEDDDEDVDAVANRAQKEAQTQYIKDGAKAQIQGMSKTISAVWVNLMRAMRRIEGHGKVGDPATNIGGSRQVFADARKRGKITSDVYVASALIEYHCYKDPAATRIFERGMRLFPEDEEFALEYLKHLIAINDITNARAVFETFVGRVPAHKSKRVWHFFYDYESQYGDLGQIYKLEKRMGELYPNDPYLNRFTTRYSYNTINPSLYQPVISINQQLRPKGIPLPPPPSTLPQQHETTSTQSSATSASATVSSQRRNEIPPSPKRSANDLDASDTENANSGSGHGRDYRPAKKVHRGDSPLKGAAGRRLDQQKQRLRSQRGGGDDGQRGDGGRMAGASGQPVSVIPDAVMFLLGIIPGAQSYNAVRFKPEAIVSLLRDVQLPQQHLGGSRYAGSQGYSM